MPKVPLVGSYNTRNNRALPASFDQRFVNFIPQIVTSPLGGTTVYQEKRQGAEQYSLVNSGKYGYGIMAWSGYYGGDSVKVTAWSDAYNLSDGFVTGNMCQVYVDGDSITNLGGFNSVGTYAVNDIFLSETTVSDVAAICVAITNDSANTLYHAFTGAYFTQYATGTSFVGDLHSNTTVDNIASTATLLAGQLVTHASIPASTRIQSVDSGTAITLTAAATGTASGQTIAKEQISKMLSATLTSSCRGGFCHLGGYTFVMDAFGIRNSALNSVTTWPADGFMPTNVYPDQGVRVVRYRNWVVAFSQGSVEFFSNTGGTGSGSPLQRIQDGTFKVGALRARNIAVSGDSVAWVGQESGSGPMGLFVLNGLGYKRLSSPTLNKILNSQLTARLCITGFLSLNGQQVITMTFTDAAGAAVVYCYSIDSQSVFEYAPGNLQHPVYAITLPSLSQTLFVSSVTTSGKVYQVLAQSPTPLFTDDGTAYTATIVTAPLFKEANSIIVHRMGVIADTQASTSNLSVSVSRNDYSSYETARTIDLALQKKQLYRLGRFNEGFIVKLEHSANTPCRLQALDFPEGAIAQLTV